MAESPKWIFRNATRRPVELHLSTGVVVLPPRGILETAEPEAICLTLEKRGVLTRHEAVEEKPKAAPKPKRATKKTSTSKAKRETTKKTPKASPPKKTTKSASRSKKKSESGKKKSSNADDGDAK